MAKFARASSFLVFVTLGSALNVSFAQAVEIPPGCRAATALEQKQLQERNAPNVNIICGKDDTTLNLGEFDQFYARLKQISPCNKNKCTLACRTRNTGAQVCGPVSRKWNSIGCHKINRTAIFPTVSHGFAAHIELLQRYCGTHKRCTIGSAIARWAPAGHGKNNPTAYAATVSKWAGFPVNKVYDPNNVDLIGRIALSMSCVENGSVPYSLNELKQGIAMAGGGQRVPVPGNVGELLVQSQGYTPSSAPVSGYLQNSAIGRFLGIPQVPPPTTPPSASSASNSVPYTPPGYLDPNRNPALNPENDPSQRRTNPGVLSSKTSTVERSTPTSQTAASDTNTGGNDVNEQTTTPRDPEFATSSTPTPTAQQTITDLTPTLLCLPGTVDVGEEAIIMYTCRDGSDTATLTSSNTTETLSGNTEPLAKERVTPTTMTTYTLTCGEDTAAQCVINVAKPALAILATPKSVARGNTTTLSWKTKDITDCAVTSNDPNHRNWQKKGTEGEVVTPTLTQNTTFSLTCETTTAQIEERSITVGVR